MKERLEKLSRRDFMKTSMAAMGAGIAGLSIPPHEGQRLSPQRVFPNDRITLALIGCGGMGAFNLQKLMEKPEVQVAALCDVDAGHLPALAASVEKKYGRRPDTYSDYRRVLERKEIDAVIIATPDHWHALPLIHACEAGKDAYCEKPISHDITEARFMANAVKHHKRIVQVGTWQRSTRDFTSAIAYIRAGKLGNITTVRAWKTDEAQVGRNAPEAPPKALDYNLWTGPAAVEPYRAKEVHFNWRWFLNYGSGMTGDWGVHMMDIALLGMSKGTDLVMPTEIATMGGKWAYPDDDRTAPDTVTSIMKFSNPNFVLHWETGQNHSNRPDHGIEFISSDGRSLLVWRGNWLLRDKDGKELPKEEAEETNDHWQNWLDCLKSRTQPRSHLASMAQTTIVCHLANAALLAGETLHWNKAVNDLEGNAGRNTQSYVREYRRPWHLPVYNS